MRARAIARLPSGRVRQDDERLEEGLNLYYDHSFFSTHRRLSDLLFPVQSTTRLARSILIKSYKSERRYANYTMQSLSGQHVPVSLCTSVEVFADNAKLQYACDIC